MAIRAPDGANNNDNNSNNSNCSNNIITKKTIFETLNMVVGRLG